MQAWFAALSELMLGMLGVLGVLRVLRRPRAWPSCNLSILSQSLSHTDTHPPTSLLPRTRLTRVIASRQPGMAPGSWLLAALLS